MNHLARSGALLLLVSSLVGCDHVTKAVAKTELEGGGGVTLLSGIFRLVYLENRDVGFNLLSWFPDPPRSTLLLVLGVSMSAVLLGILLRYRSASRWQLAALCLAAAGALGNTIDRVARGYVVDFLHVQHWPVFNVADIYVTVAAIALFLSLRARPSTSAP